MKRIGDAKTGRENIQNAENKYQYMNNINSENLASVVKEQTVEYREQNHCFNTEKSLV